MLPQVQISQPNNILAYLISSPPFFPLLPPVLLPEPASRVRDAQKAVQYVESEVLIKKEHNDREQT